MRRQDRVSVSRMVRCSSIGPIFTAQERSLVLRRRDRARVRKGATKEMTAKAKLVQSRMSLSMGTVELEGFRPIKNPPRGGLVELVSGGAGVGSQPTKNPPKRVHSGGSPADAVPPASCVKELPRCQRGQIPRGAIRDTEFF
jgi:hypothetical protein